MFIKTPYQYFVHGQYLLTRIIFKNINELNVRDTRNKIFLSIMLVWAKEIDVFNLTVTSGKLQAESSRTWAV